MNGLRKKLTQREILKRAADIVQWAIDVCPRPTRIQISEYREIVSGLKRMAKNK